MTQPLNRNECQEYILGGKGGRCVGLITLIHSCADCLDIWEPQPPGTFGLIQACNGTGLPYPLPLTKKLTGTSDSFGFQAAAVAYPGILFGGVQQIQLSTEDLERTGICGR